MAFCLRCFKKFRFCILDIVFLYILDLGLNGRRGLAIGTARGHDGRYEDTQSAGQSAEIDDYENEATC